ncbi:MAG: S-layer homology domain-containing protein [Firmicutes bacterium]|nr:S-layer homology domain-containing protein [Bacillota bacterium]
MIKDGKVTTLNDSNYDLLAAVPRGLAVKDGKLYVADVYFPTPIEEKIEALSFSDVNDADKATVDMAVSAKIINGFPDGTFKPAASVTRAEFVTMLSRAQLYMNGATVINGDPLFKDVNADDWYAKQAYWAADAGLLKGRINQAGDIVLDPNATLPGNELALFIERLATNLGVKYTAPDSLAKSTAAVTRLKAAESVVDMLKQAGYF